MLAIDLAPSTDEEFVPTTVAEIFFLVISRVCAGMATPEDKMGLVIPRAPEPV